MRERVLVYVAEKQSIEESKILLDVSIALAEQQGDIVVAVVSELSEKNHMSKEAFLTIANIVEDFELDKVIVLVPEMIHADENVMLDRDSYLATYGAELAAIFARAKETEGDKEIIVPFPLRKAVRKRPEHITVTTFKR